MSGGYRTAEKVTMQQRQKALDSFGDLVGAASDALADGFGPDEVTRSSSSTRGGSASSSGLRSSAR